MSDSYSVVYSPKSNVREIYSYIAFTLLFRRLPKNR